MINRLHINDCNMITELVSQSTESLWSDDRTSIIYKTTKCRNILY